MRRNVTCWSEGQAQCTRLWFVRERQGLGHASHSTTKVQPHKSHPVTQSWQPHLWYKCARDGVTLERFHRAFVDGLVQYGMIRAVKKKAAA